jgi:hypothetical protein
MLSLSGKQVVGSCVCMRLCAMRDGLLKETLMRQHAAGIKKKARTQNAEDGMEVESHRNYQLCIIIM